MIIGFDRVEFPVVPAWNSPRVKGGSGLNRSIVLSMLVLLLACSASLAQEVQVATTIAFIEGPTADAEGNVFFTDQANNRIMKLSNDGRLSTFRQPANYANGMVFDTQWRLVACEGGDPGK